MFHMEKISDNFKIIITFQQKLEEPLNQLFYHTLLYSTLTLPLNS